MPRTYKPVSEKAIPWAALMKVIKEAGTSGIALYDLASHFGVKPESRRFKVGMQTVRRMGLVSESMGATESGIPAIVVQEKGNGHEPRRTQI